MIALLRARNCLLWIVTREEARAERVLFAAALQAKYVPHTWDIAQGAADLKGTQERIGGPSPDEMLTAIRERSLATPGTRDVWIMRDLPPWLVGLPNAPVLRQLRNLARSLPETPLACAQAIIVLSPSSDVPAELADHATVIEFPLPDREEIAAILDATLNSQPAEIRDSAAPNGTRELAIDSAVGMSGEQAMSTFSHSLIQLRRIDPAMVAKEKKRIIASERVLEWFDPISGGLDAVGGLENLKAWLAARRDAYGPAARAYRLPTPKGALLAGVSGCGKSLTAKAIATAWGVPLLRIDLGGLKSKFVGESEGNLRKALRVIEAIGRCVVWIDELEKALAGATQGGADGGVSSDALGTLLSWMQERAGQAFLIATANDVSGLPPELLRKGRFDEIFFVDLPTQSERIAILQTALRTHGREGVTVDTAAIARACNAFTGSEVAELVPSALFAAFAQNGREIRTADLLTAAAETTPLTETMGEKIAALRKWANGRARPASKEETAAEAVQESGGRKLDL